jgi:long-chain fatty acid transport protein
LFYNPGGAPFIDSKFSFSGGMSFIMARATFQATDVAYQANLKHQLNTPFYFYASYKPIKNLSVGLAVNTPYGNKLAWPDDWKGRYLIQNLSFQAITFQPTIAYKFGDYVGIGAGFVIANGTVDLNKAVPIDGASSDGTMNLKGSTTQYGWNAGIMVHPFKGLSLGLDYRSEIKMAVKNASVKFNVPASVAINFPDNQADVTLPLPANLDFGISYEINDKWMIGLDLNYVYWNVYDSLVFNFHTVTPTVQRTATPALYEGQMITRIGVQWKACKVATLRVGGYYDPSPVQDDYLHPQTPSADEIGLTCGISIYPVKKLSIDASFLYLMGLERKGQYLPDNFAGTYKAGFYIPGIGLTYNF